LAFRQVILFLQDFVTLQDLPGLSKVDFGDFFLHKNTRGIQNSRPAKDEVLQKNLVSSTYLGTAGGRQVIDSSPF
jgi:hypothetical protein